jgi:glycosyltransferase involved in cell wall biosynthesis
MINVLHLTSSFGLGGGAEKNLLRLVCNMDRSTFHNTVVTMTDIIADRDYECLRSQLSGTQVPVYSLGMRRGRPTIAGTTRLLRIIRHARPVILQSWMYHADLLGLLAARIAGVPSVAWNLRCSSMDMKHYRRLSGLVLRILIPLSRLPDVVIANSESGIQAHTALGYAPRRWLYIPNTLNLDEFKPNPEAKIQVRHELGLPEDAILIGLVARYHPMKDHANFVHAMNLVAEEASNVRFVLVGKGADPNNAELMRLVRATGVGDRFHLIGHTLDVGRLTASFDLACSSSRFGEGTSNSLAEAMACAVPCVATDVGDSQVIVHDTGRVVPPGDPVAFARACGDLLGMSAQQRRQLGWAARERVKALFSIDGVVRQYESLYKELAPFVTKSDNSERRFPMDTDWFSGNQPAQRIF